MSGLILSNAVAKGFMAHKHNKQEKPWHHQVLHATQKTSDVLHVVLNGLVGDTLATINMPLAMKMSFRENDADLALESIGIRLKTKKNVVIFVHGLMADHKMWISKTPNRQGFGSKIEKDFSDTLCLYVRFNSGLHISDNGKDLAQLIESFFKMYGDKVKSITLIGHSLGGLVIRSSEYVALQKKHAWIQKYNTCLLLAPPLAGSHWEQLGFTASFVLKNIWNIPTRIIGAIGDLRSSGIHDLRHGLLVEDDWKNHDQKKVFSHKKTIVPLLPQVDYHVLLGMIAQKEASQFKKFFGDGLFNPSSGYGKSFFKDEDPLTKKASFKLFYKTGHMKIAFSPVVYRHIKKIISILK